MRRSALILFLLVASSRLHALEAPPATDCNAPDLPSFSKTTLVAERIAINGLPMQILQARNAMPSEQFLAHFRNLWTATENGVSKPLYVEYPVQNWKVIAHREGGCFYTVQVHPNALNTTALVGISTPDRPAPLAAGPEISLPGGSKLLSQMASQDQSRLGDTWVAKSDHSVLEAVRYFRGSLAASGWQALTRKDPETSYQTATLMFQKASRNLGIVIQPSAAGSTIVLTVQSR